MRTFTDKMQYMVAYIEQPAESRRLETAGSFPYQKSVIACNKFIMSCKALWESVNI